MDLTEKTTNHHRHPWELSRSYCILKLLRKNDQNTIYADIGSGDKFFISKLRSLTRENAYAIDIAYPDERLEQDGLISLNKLSALDNESVDYFIVMDVLEHIENDTIFLQEIFTKLKPGGKILITVPAWQFLFSSHDVFLKHYRRYSKKTLNATINKEIIVEKSFYFYSSLLILRILLLIFEKLTGKKVKNVGVGLWKYRENALITRLFFVLLNIDFFINKTLSAIGLNLPGLSLLVIGRKK